MTGAELTLEELLDELPDSEPGLRHVIFQKEYAVFTKEEAEAFLEGWCETASEGAELDAELGEVTGCSVAEWSAVDEDIREIFVLHAAGYLTLER